MVTVVHAVTCLMFSVADRANCIGRSRLLEMEVAWGTLARVLVQKQIRSFESTDEYKIDLVDGWGSIVQA